MTFIVTLLEALAVEWSGFHPVVTSLFYLFLILVMFAAIVIVLLEEIALRT